MSGSEQRTNSDPRVVTGVLRAATACLGTTILSNTRAVCAAAAHLGAFLAKHLDTARHHGARAAHRHTPAAWLEGDLLHRDVGAFSYYGMRALPVIYVVNAVGYTRDDALTLYGVYTGLVYLTPLFGGALADRLLGQRRAAVIGGTVMMLGHFAMAFSGLLHVALG